MRWAGALSLLALGGCDKVFSVPLSIADAALPGCVMPLASSDFEVPMMEPCAGFGFANGEAAMTVASGVLSIEYPLNGVGTAGGSCTADGVPFHDGGVFIEVAKIFDASATSVFFQTIWLDAVGAMQVATFSASAASVELVIGGASSGRVPFDGRSRWWRLRPDRARDRVVGEVSPDGASWTRFGEGGTGVAAAVKVVFGGVIDATVATTAGAAQFESINVCP